MSYFVNFIFLLTFVIILWRSFHLFGLRAGKIYFDPAIFFVIGFLLLVFIPHFCIYNFTTFESFYVTFSQGETTTAILTACLFGLVWITVVSAFPAPFQSIVAEFNRGAAEPEKQGIKLAGIAIFLLLSLSLDFLLFGISGSVGSHIVAGIVRGDLSGFYTDYNELRYAATTQPLLESGIRGMGTLTAIMDFTSYAALALAFHATKGTRFYVAYPIRALLALIVLFVAFATGARTKTVYFAAFFTVVIMITGGKNSIRTALQGLVVGLGLLIVFTALTPKADVGQHSNPLLSVVYRLSGNAVNDAVIIEAQESGEFTFSNSLFGGGGDFEALDRQLTYFYTQDPSLPWYETPTCIAGYFVTGGFFSVVLNAIVTGLFCRFLSYLVRQQQDPGVLVPMFAAACVINLQMPLTGWFSPAVILGAFLSFGILKAINFCSRFASQEKAPGNEGAIIHVPECGC